MTEIVIRQAALDDLDSIYRYTANTWSIAQAEKYYRSIQKACQNLAEHSELGKTYRHIMTGLQGYHVKKHIVFYASRGDKIEIISKRRVHTVHRFNTVNKKRKRKALETQGNRAIKLTSYTWRITANKATIFVAKIAPLLKPIIFYCVSFRYFDIDMSKYL